MRILLASGSPRRVEILKMTGMPFDVQPADVDESLLPGETPVDYVTRLARTKATSISSETPALIIGADTTVVVDHEILAKPTDAEDARRMLQQLSGRSHEVLTGVAVHRTSDGTIHSAYEVTRVWFDELPEDWIEAYIASGEPLDRAGAYAIQGAVAAYADRIEGNYLNVVGLPLPLVRRLLIALKN